MTRLLSILFGCRHDLGWPRKSWNERKTRFSYHQTCVICGAQVNYRGPLA